MNENRKEINKALAKPLAITAGVLGLIQGIAWTVFSILCILCYFGSLIVDPPQNVTDAKYYQLIYYTFLEQNSNFTQLNPQFIVKPQEFFIFMWFYLIFSIIWAVISGSIIWMMIHNKWNLGKSVFGVWSGTTILISIVDIVLTGLIANDYILINSMVGIPTDMLVTYGIVMSLAARGYVLWVINVIFFVIMMKFTVEIIMKENDTTAMPIIHGFESTDINPPWFSSDVKDFWASPQRTISRNDGYDNMGFERSQSFLPLSNAIPDQTPSTPSNIYSTTPTTKTTPTGNGNMTPFAQAIANKTATIGRNKGRRTPPNEVRPPYIPDPDYTPPGSPNGLKSVLRTTSNYSKPMY